MKKNNVAKRFGIATLCLATAISAFSGITSVAASNVAVADGTTVKLTDLVTVSEGATVAQETRDVIWKKNATAASAAKCLRISSSDAYEATFNQIFQGNTELRFAFPERLADFADADGNVPTASWGNFKFTITDAADADNFFDIVYYRTGYGSTIRVEWNGHTIQTDTGNGASTYNATSGTYYYDTELDTRTSFSYAPSFMGAGANYVTREAKLQLKWTSAGQLWVVSNSTIKQDASDRFSSVIAKFDGSYDETATKCGFVSKSKWGLPMMTFPNGYKISFSSYMDVAEEDRKDATDVSFWRIKNDCTGTTYGNLDTDGAYYTAFADDAFTKNNYMKAYDSMKANAGKTLIGWKDATGLQTTATALKSADISAYDPVFLGFDTMKGASVRIDPTGGESGIRFMTLFDKADYATAAPYIQSQGTLIAYTDKLTKGRLDAVNYATEIAADPATTVAQVPNTKSKMFNYNVATNRLDDENGQPAYSMALTGIEDYAQTYSARGYLVVVYADGTTTQTFYTDYNETDNARSIQEVAQLLQQTADYQNYEQYQKDVVDLYAGGAPETQE